jgi:ribosome biogenesis protein Nip4
VDTKRDAKSVRGTHTELTNPTLRLILANELLVLRAAMRVGGQSMDSDFVYGVRTGLDTFARRLEDIQERGVRIVYTQNYKP